MSFSQSDPPCDLRFINYLVNKGDYEDAVFLLDSKNCNFAESTDSINYLRGWSNYSLKKLNLSSESLLKVTPNSGFYHKSHFFAAYNYAHLEYYKKATQTLLNMNVNSEKLLSLRDFELSGIYLLEGNEHLFEETFSKVNGGYFEISSSYDNIRKISIDSKDHKARSPLLAGVMSGVIPGSGKFYAGKRGEAISAFIATTGLGFVAFENLRKSGFRNYKTIIFGTAFAFSYAANIYGAVVTINILETEYRDNVKNSILFNLHIPLRNTFNK